MKPFHARLFIRWDAHKEVTEPVIVFGITAGAVDSAPIATYAAVDGSFGYAPVTDLRWETIGGDWPATPEFLAEVLVK